jgi:hypothetical protein
VVALLLNTQHLLVQHVKSRLTPKNKHLSYMMVVRLVVHPLQKQYPPLGSAAAPTYTFTGDTNTGIYSPGADQVAVATNGTGRLFVDANGNVGVGLSGPSYPLEVAAPADSTINITGGTSNVCRLFFSDTALARGFLNYAHADDSLHIGTAGTERLRITSAGRVGIGTTAPSAPIDVFQAASGIVARFTGNGNTTTFNGFAVEATGTLNRHLRLISGASQVFRTYESSTGNISTDTEITFDSSAQVFRNSDGTAERGRWDGSGRLLVGTSSSNGTFASGVQIAGSSSAGTQLISAFNNNVNGGELYLAKSRSGTVGTNTVVQNGDSLGLIGFYGADGTTYQPGAYIRATVDGSPGSADLPTRLTFSTTADGASSPTERWRIDSSGSLVGVAGSAFVAPYVYNTTTATAANVNVDASGFLRRSTSSIKYKTNVETIQDQYADAILGCRPVWYQSTCEADKPDWGHWGFIAEEVAEIDPRLCFFKEEEDGTLEPEGVQYDRFVPHLLNLIKRQQQAIETLEGMVAVNNITIDEQQHQLSTLAARLTALESA